MKKYNVYFLTAFLVIGSQTYSMDTKITSVEQISNYARSEVISFVLKESVEKRNELFKNISNFANTRKTKSEIKETNAAIIQFFNEYVAGRLASVSSYLFNTTKEHYRIITNDNDLTRYLEDKKFLELLERAIIHVYDVAKKLQINNAYSNLLDQSGCVWRACYKAIARDCDHENISYTKNAKVRNSLITACEKLFNAVKNIIKNKDPKAAIAKKSFQDMNANVYQATNFIKIKYNKHGL